jgi:hypothetical protein
MKTYAPAGLAEEMLAGARALDRLERLVATVHGSGQSDPKFASALAMLDTLSRKEDIPVAIIGGMAAIHHGYERLTKDIDIVVGKNHLAPFLQVAPNYGIKVVWRDVHGWHKFNYDGVAIEIVPEGGRARKDSPTTIPGPTQLGVAQGSGYSNLEGWVETKLSSGRIQDRADVVWILKRLDSVALARVSKHLGSVHRSYLRLFDELCELAREEIEQERERGGPR